MIMNMKKGSWQNLQTEPVSCDDLSWLPEPFQRLASKQLETWKKTKQNKTKVNEKAHQKNGEYQKERYFQIDWQGTK